MIVTRQSQAITRMNRQIRELITAFDGASIAWALIGGLAMIVHEVVRATQDVDMLIDADNADRAEAILTSLGYVCIHRSPDAGNYERADQRTDLLYAGRPVARRLLENAQHRDTPLGTVRVVGVEGLIGFKLQAVVNDPRRTQDLSDIRALLRIHHARLNMAEVRSYFALFDREATLDQLLEEVR